MFTHQFFDLLLNLNDCWKVEQVDADYLKEGITIKIKYIGKTAECPETFEDCEVYDHAPERVWRHLDTMQYKTHISCGLPRVKNSSGKIITVTPPWASKHGRHTILFEHAVIDLLQATKNQTKTAELMRCGFDVVNRIIHLSVDRGLERRPKDVAFTNLSIDEKSFRKGHHYVTVLRGLVKIT